MSQYAKAFVPVIIGVLMLVLNQFGVTETTTVVEFITMLVTAARSLGNPQQRTDRSLIMRRLVCWANWIFYLYVLLRAVVVN